METLKILVLKRKVVYLADLIQTLKCLELKLPNKKSLLRMRCQISTSQNTWEGSK